MPTIIPYRPMISISYVDRTMEQGYYDPEKSWIPCSFEDFFNDPHLIQKHNEIEGALGTYDVPDKPSVHRPEISNGLRKRVFERDAYRCQRCNTHLDLAVDHIIPISKGGTNDFENLQTLCKSCNSKKGVSVADPA